MVLKKKINLLHLNSYFQGTDLHRLQIQHLEEKEVLNQSLFVPISYSEQLKRNPFENNPSIHVVIEACFGLFARLFWPLKMIQIWKRFQIHYRNQTFDLLHAHTLFVNGLIAFLHFKKTGTPYIVTIRSADISTFLKRIPFMKFIAAPILENATTIILLSSSFWDNDLQNTLLKRTIRQIENKIKIIPNGINEFWYNNLETVEKEKNNHFKVLYVGELSKNKRVQTIIKACQKLDENGVNVICDIVGEGPERTYLEQIDVSFKINFLGKVIDKHALLKMYRDADVLIVPSRRETFGLVFAEAISQGTPVIYSKGQGFDGQFKDGEVGFPVESGNIDDISNKLLQVNQNHIALNKQVLKVGRRFSWTEITNQLLDAYTIIISLDS